MAYDNWYPDDGAKIQQCCADVDEEARLSAPSWFWKCGRRSRWRGHWKIVQRPAGKYLFVCFCMVAWLVGPQCEGAILKELASWRLFSWIRHWDWIHVENWENKLDWMFSWEKKSVETGSK